MSKKGLHKLGLTSKEGQGSTLIVAGIGLYLNLESRGGVKFRWVGRQKRKLVASKR